MGPYPKQTTQNTPPAPVMDGAATGSVAGANALGNLALMGTKFMTNVAGIPIDVKATVQSFTSNEGGQAIMSAGRTMFGLATGTLSAQEYMATLTPDQILDGIAATDPAWKETVAGLKQDDEFKNAFKDAIVSDPTFLPGILKLSQGQGSQAFMPILMDGLKDPEQRAKITMALQDVPNANFNYNDFVKETSSVMKEGYFKNILDNPEKIGGLIGSLGEMLGLPPSVTNAIAGFLPKIYEAITSAPGVIARMYTDDPEFQEINRNYIQPVIAEGRNNIQTFGFNN